jgi:cytochrome d ubiquinol oxidase subunit II
MAKFSSCAIIAGILGATAAMTFPILLRSSGDPSRSLSAYSAAVRPAGLSTALGWFSVGAPLALAYLVTLFRLHRGKVAAARDGEGY